MFEDAMGIVNVTVVILRARPSESSLIVKIRPPKQSFWLPGPLDLILVMYNQLRSIQ